MSECKHDWIGARSLPSDTPLTKNVCAKCGAVEHPPSSPESLGARVARELFPYDDETQRIDFGGIDAEREACAKIVNAEKQTAAVSRDRAAAAGRNTVAACRQSDVETCDRLLAAIRARGE